MDNKIKTKCDCPYITGDHEEGIPGCHHFTHTPSLTTKDQASKFLEKLDKIVFVKTTDLGFDGKEDVTYELNPQIEDREATIKINAEFDREEFIKILESTLSDQRQEIKAKIDGLIKEHSHEGALECARGHCKYVLNDLLQIIN